MNVQYIPPSAASNSDISEDNDVKPPPTPPQPKPDKLVVHKKTAKATTSKIRDYSVTRTKLIDLTNGNPDSGDFEFDVTDPLENTTYNIKGKNAIFKAVAPYVQQQRIIYNKGVYSRGGNVREATVKSSKADNIGFRNFPYHFTKHWIDPDYIKECHLTIIGKMAAWRNHTIHAIDRINEIGAFPKKQGERQYNFAKTKVLRLMEGVSAFKTVPVTILHGDAVMRSVDGAETQEIADLLINISNCETFHIDFVKKGDDYEIETVFEAKMYEDKRSYGKDPNAV